MKTSHKWSKNTTELTQHYSNIIQRALNVVCLGQSQGLSLLGLRIIIACMVCTQHMLRPELYYLLIMNTKLIYLHMIQEVT